VLDVAALHRADGSTEDAVEPEADSDHVDVTAKTRKPVHFFRRFKAWRRRRPFWGAVFSIFGGAEILYLQSAPMRLVIHFGLVGQLGFAVPILIILCGVLLLFAPNPRIFYASLVLVLGLASWVTSNLGGFIIGMLNCLIGGTLALAWTTEPKAPRTKTAK
jgi:hypothetical protein